MAAGLGGAQRGLGLDAKWVFGTSQGAGGSSSCSSRGRRLGWYGLWGQS